MLQSLAIRGLVVKALNCFCRYEDVNHYEQKAPHAKKAHPWPDHFYPLHVAIGAAGEDAKAKLIHSSIELGSLSYASYQFTSAAS